MLIGMASQQQPVHAHRGGESATAIQRKRSKETGHRIAAQYSRSIEEGVLPVAGEGVTRVDQAPWVEGVGVPQGVGQA